jgi:hypothetical protein
VPLPDGHNEVRTKPIKDTEPTHIYPRSLETKKVETKPYYKKSQFCQPFLRLQKKKGEKRKEATKIHVPDSRRGN